MSSLLNYYYDYGYQCFQQATISVLKKGKVPRHIAFILDGNRRFANKMGAKSTLSGHKLGGRKLKEVLDICFRLGTHEVTVYAFSIENFKRSQDEVDYLMKLFYKLFGDLCAEGSVAMKNDMKVQIMGDLDYLPKHVLDVAKRVMEVTKNHKSRKFNVCVPYTSRNEMTNSIKQNVQMVMDGELDSKDVSQKTIEEHLFTSASYPLDLLVRTSGETRLSDFLLYQVSQGCQIQFIDCLWPEITLLKMLHVLLEHQLYYNNMQKGSISYKC